MKKSYKKDTEAILEKEYIDALGLEFDFDDRGYVKCPHGDSMEFINRFERDERERAKIMWYFDEAEKYFVIVNGGMILDAGSREGFENLDI